MRPEGAKEYVMKKSDLKSEENLHKLYQEEHSWQWKCPHWSGWWVLENSGNKFGLKQKGEDGGIHSGLYLVSLKVLDF